MITEPLVEGEALWILPLSRRAKWQIGQSCPRSQTHWNILPTSSCGQPPTIDRPVTSNLRNKAPGLSVTNCKCSSYSSCIPSPTLHPPLPPSLSVSAQLEPAWPHWPTCSTASIMETSCFYFALRGWAAASHSHGSLVSVSMTRSEYEIHTVGSHFHRYSYAIYY